MAAALQAGKPELALAKIDDRIAAMKASGMPTKSLEAVRAQVESDPKQALGYVLRVASALPGSDKLLQNLTALETEQRTAAAFPLQQKKLAAEASAAETEAAIKAKYGEQSALLDIQKKGWDVTKIQADIQIAKEANRIAAMNAATSRANSDLQRQELQLKVDDARAKLNDKIREKVATAEAGASSIDNMLNTIERIKKNPNLNDVVGAIEGRLPALTSDASADAIALIDTLGSQAFLAQIPNIKGMGALSNAEGEKLQSALTNLSRKQSEEQFRANLDEASRLLNKGRENLSRATGVPLGKPDTPAKPGARPPLESFNR